jgi:Ser/Thr protein kinase RdoA (MazF antagonist)
VDTHDVARAVAAVTSAVAGLDLPVEGVNIIENSTRLSLRLLPCDLLSCVAPMRLEVAAAREIELAVQLVARSAPVVAPDVRVGAHMYPFDGFAVSLWTYHPGELGQIQPAEYAHAFGRLHAALSDVDAATSHFTDRVAEAERLAVRSELRRSIALAVNFFWTRFGVRCNGYAPQERPSSCFTVSPIPEIS